MVLICTGHRSGRAILDNANLKGAKLSSTNLNGTSLVNADLLGANLRYSLIVAADVSGARFSGGRLYGCAIWNLRGEPKEQRNIVITPDTEPVITVDNIEVGQFVFLILNNRKILNWHEHQTEPRMT